MKRALIWLAAAAALTGCKIHEAEDFDPTREGFYIFREANRCLGETAADATRVLLFDLYYSASEEEREVVHNRYFYSSRIVISDDACHIIDGTSDLIIYTGGQPLSAEGAVWRYAYSSQSCLESEMPTISCRKHETGPDTYDLRLPDGNQQWSVTPLYCTQRWPDSLLVRTENQRHGQFVRRGLLPRFRNRRLRNTRTAEIQFGKTLAVPTRKTEADRDNRPRRSGGRRPICRR